MICPSSLPPHRRERLTDQEVARIYMDPGTRWKDDKGRYWLVFRRTEELFKKDDGKMDSRTTLVQFINLATERREGFPIELVAQRVREGKFMRVEDTLELRQV